MQETWYTPNLDYFSKGQRGYVDLLSGLFNVKNPKGEIIPYQQTAYQEQFHAASLNILEEKAKDILFNKARGISFTTSSSIELIMTASGYDEQTIPVIAHREKNAFKILENIQWLIDNCNSTELKRDVICTKSCIRFKSTNSTIEAFPSSSAADAVRSIRLIRALVDEFAFQQNDEALFTAIGDCIQSDFGQILYGSTPCGRNNKYYNMVQDSKAKRDTSYKLFNLPVFNPTKFNPKRSILEQGLKPIAPWISLKKLEEKRKRDWRIFMQENMCDFLDDGQSLISYSTIMKRVNEELPNYKKHLWSDFVYTSGNPIMIGVDFAELVDLFAVVVYEGVTIGNKVVWTQRFLDYFNGIETPELTKYMQEVFRMFPTFQLCRVDKTGSGSGLATNLKRLYNHRIKRVNFASSISILGKKDKENIRNFMINNIKNMMETEDDIVQLINDDMQISHMGALDYSFKVTRGKEKGHGDIFFANALALIPAVQRVPMMTNLKTPNNDAKLSPLMERPQETWGDKFKRLKKNQRKMARRI